MQVSIAPIHLACSIGLSKLSVSQYLPSLMYIVFPRGLLPHVAFDQRAGPHTVRVTQISIDLVPIFFGMWPTTTSSTVTASLNITVTKVSLPIMDFPGQSLNACLKPLLTGLTILQRGSGVVVTQRISTSASLQSTQTFCAADFLAYGILESLSGLSCTTALVATWEDIGAVIYWAIQFFL